ncbi:hypothetical protein BZL30_3584 [Mycobacterium kansasii]|uniref:Uncharacterized protein n=1 Tax=Mycobacterium kansasii TaxID=1768 RepID=A0A1V3XAL7_MYCKA|nr:hypothetical protein BZL30_3584 [Mycobacterium kansasii]
MVAALTAQLDRSWRDIRAGDIVVEPFLAGLGTVLGAATGHSAAAARQRVWWALISDATRTTWARWPASTMLSCRGRS